jgi:hypothetical protein
MKHRHHERSRATHEATEGNKNTLLTGTPKRAPADILLHLRAPPPTPPGGTPHSGVVAYMQTMTASMAHVALLFVVCAAAVAGSSYPPETSQNSLHPQVE